MSRELLPVRPSALRRAGRLMQVLAVIGVVTAVIGTFVGWRLVGHTERTLGDSLELVDESLTTLQDTIVVAEQVIASVDVALQATEQALNSVVGSFDGAESVVTSLDDFVGVVAPGVRDVAATLDDLAQVGTTIDTVLGQLDALPFGPDYDPAQPLGVQLEELAAQLDPIADGLTETSAELSDFVDDTGMLQADIDALADAVAAVNDDLSESESLLATYTATTENAQRLAADTRGDLGSDISSARILVVVLGAVFALGQLVPFWVGRELRRSAQWTSAPEDSAGLAA